MPKRQDPFRMETGRAESATTVPSNRQTHQSRQANTIPQLHAEAAEPILLEPRRETLGRPSGALGAPPGNLLAGAHSWRPGLVVEAALCRTR